MAIAKLASVNEWAVSIDGTNWVPIYVPAPNIKIEHTNVASSDSGRTEDGVMHINWVRRDVRKVNLLYNAISGNEKYHMEYEIFGGNPPKGMQGQEFWIRYPDGKAVEEGNVLVHNVVEFHGYCGESNYQYYSSVHYPKEGGIYTNYSINVIEF